MKGSEIDDPDHLIGLNQEDSPIGELANSQSRFVHCAPIPNFLSSLINYS